MDARKEMAQLMRTSMEQPSQDTLFGEPAPEPQVREVVREVEVVKEVEVTRDVIPDAALARLDALAERAEALVAQAKAG